MKKIKEFASLKNGYAFKSKNYVKQGIRIIRIANVQDGYVVDDAPCFYPENSSENITQYQLFENDLLISLTGNAGRVALLPKTMLPAALNQRVCCLRIDETIVNRKYLFYYLRRKQFVKDCIDASKGVAQLNLSTKWLEDYEVPVPSIAEQKRIVARIEELFSQLDKAVETLQMVKEQLAVYRQAVLKDAFAQYNELIKIRECSEVVTSGSRGWAKYYSDEGAKFIRIGNLTRDSISIKLEDVQYVMLPDTAEGRRTRLKKNDVLVSITADLGSIGFVQDNLGEAYINQHIALVRFLKPELGNFMAWYLKSDWGQKHLLKNKRGAGKLGLGLDDIRDTLVPKILGEDAKQTVDLIDKRLSFCADIETTINNLLIKTEAMRQSILKQAFEGKW